MQEENGKEVLVLKAIEEAYQNMKKIAELFMFWRCMLSQESKATLFVFALHTWRKAAASEGSE